MELPPVPPVVDSALPVGVPMSLPEQCVIRASVVREPWVLCVLGSDATVGPARSPELLSGLISVPSTLSRGADILSSTTLRPGPSWPIRSEARVRPEGESSRKFCVESP